MIDGDQERRSFTDDVHPTPLSGASDPTLVRFEDIHGSWLGANAYALALAAIIALFMIMLVCIGVFTRIVPMIFAILPFLGIIVIAIAGVHSYRNSRDKLAAELAAADSLARLPDIRSRIQFWGVGWVFDAIQMAARNGLRNLTVRISTKSRTVHVMPLAVPFEPIPLDESEDSFHALRGAMDRNPAQERGEMMRFMRRRIALAGGRLEFGMTVASFVILIVMIPIMFRRAAGWQIAMMLGIPFSTFISKYLLTGGIAPARLIVPSGLLFRRRMKTGNQSGLTLFTRTSSTLVIMENAARNWAVLVADSERSMRFHATKSEMELLLAAWLSPLAPPPLERLKDFE